MYHCCLEWIEHVAFDSVYPFRVEISMSFALVFHIKFGPVSIVAGMCSVC